METREYRNVVDRKDWPAGPWDGEPDKMQWPDAETGLPCLAVRSRDSGNWCGYVGVAEGHPAFGQDYSAWDCNVDLEVHGGVTFADRCANTDDESRFICHVPGEGEPDHVWWLGFDCAHCMDYGPRDAMYARDKPEYFWKVDSDRSYRTLAYVRNQCASLAKQLAAAA